MANLPKFARYARQEDFDADREAGSVADGIVCFVEDTKRIWLHGNYYTVDESEIAGLLDAYLPLTGGTVMGDMEVKGSLTLKVDEKGEGDYMLSCNEDGITRMTLRSEIDEWLSTTHGGTVQENVSFEKRLNVGGQATFDDTIDCRGNLLVGANMTVDDEVLLKSDLTVDGTVNLSSLEETEDTDVDVLVQTSAGGGTVFGYSLQNLIETVNAGSDTLSDGVYVAYQANVMTDSGSVTQNLLCSVEDYSGSGTPLGAYIVEGGTGLLVSLEGSRKSLPFGAGSGGVTTGAYETDNERYALQDMEGRENTRSTWEHDTYTSRTWGYCRSFALGEIGTAKWWLPSMGELDLIRRNLDGVNAVFTKLGGSTIGASDRLFSSTMYLIPYECWWLGMDGVSGYAQATESEEHVTVPVTSFAWQKRV